MRTASNVAWVAAATHLVASLAMLVLLREGLPDFSAEERLAYIHAHRAGWFIGWTLWQIAAMSLLAFYAVLAMRYRGVLSVTALMIATAGFALDFSSEARYIAVLPELAGAEFARLDRELEVLIGYAANGLYTSALLLFLIAGRKELPLPLGVAVVIAGYVLAAASLLHDARLEMISSAVLFPLFTLWMVLVARWLRRAA